MAFTDEQLLLLDSKAKIVVGCAFPGTGKTYTLEGKASRYQGDKKVLVTTFTKKCKKELESRLKGGNYDITTIHGLALRVVKSNWAFLGELIGAKHWPTQPTVLFKFEEEMELISESGRPEKLLAKLVPYLRKFKVEPTKLLGLFDSGTYFNGYNRNQILEYIHYESARQLAGILIPNDFVFFANKLLKFPAISQEFYNDYGLVLVDEAQDLDVSYWNMLEPFMWGDCQLLMIGDYNQAIYSFNGGNGVVFSYLMNHPESEVINLNYNFRSKKRIVDIINTIKPEVEMKATSYFDGQAYYGQFDNIIEEANFIRLHPDAVVLARTNKYLDSLREMIPDLKGYTIHQSKGKEWNKVILAGCQENIIPFPLNKNPEEELNLFYVACSRAKSELLITCSAEPSRYLKNLINEKKIENIKTYVN